MKKLLAALFWAWMFFVYVTDSRDLAWLVSIFCVVECLEYLNKWLDFKLQELKCA